MIDEQPLEMVKKPNNFTTICIRKSTRSMLDHVRYRNETVDKTVRRLIDKRKFDIVNGEIVDSDPKDFGDIMDEVDDDRISEVYMEELPEGFEAPESIEKSGQIASRFQDVE